MRTRRRRLPPLQSLVAFEAVGRRLSIRLAAEELSVTYSAVSHQIRLLESFFSVPLFAAKGRSLHLTPQGQRLLETVTGSLDSIERRIQEANTVENLHHLRIAASTAIASSSIPGYLAEFLDDSAPIDVTWVPLEEIDDSVDVIISYTEVQDLGDSDIHYIMLNYFMVCAPALIGGRPPPGSIADLNDQIFLHGDYDGAEWKRFLSILGQKQVIPKTNVYLGNFLLATHAAKRGCGLAIADELMVSAELASGELIRPMPIEVPAPQPARIIIPSRNTRNPVVLRFREWFIEKVSDTARVL